MNARQYQINFEIITAPLYVASANAETLAQFKASFDDLAKDVTDSLSYGYTQTLACLWLPDLLDVNVADENVSILFQAADHMIDSLKLDERMRFTGAERASSAMDAGFYTFADYLSAKGYADIHQCADATLYSDPQVQTILHNAHLRHVASMAATEQSTPAKKQDPAIGQFTI